ncbi:MAG: hypothetical protein HMLKMBBP_03377 [Planctomycetes bacterium]|nr:hypothetical protein [Planctomycetota bacterium]
MSGMTRFLVALVAACAALFVGPAAASPENVVSLVDAFPGVTFDRPLAAVQPPDGTDRMFVVEQGGRVWITDHPAPAPPGQSRKTLFLDLSADVSRLGNEEGLLGFAFHPDFAANRRFFVQYSARYTQSSQRRNVVSEMTSRADDPDAADRAGERIVMQIAQPYENHNGGWLGFGADGMLYIAVGDGGSAEDPLEAGQRLDTRLAKILRIDVDSAQPYAVPNDNPFVSRQNALPEIWAYGLRNPWRCSFDRQTGDLWAGDVGQYAVEEIDRIVPGGNYGWDRKEGNDDFEPEQFPPADPLRAPVATYGHGVGQSVTGGFVYRGSAVECLAGKYVFGDFETGRIWALDDPYGDADMEDVLDTDELIASFGEDRDGELFVCSFTGKVLRVVDDGEPPAETPLPPELSDLGIFADLESLRPVQGALRYDVLSPLWSDGAEKPRFLVLPEGEAMTWRDADAFDVPAGTIAVKSFTRGGERLETRVIRRTATGFQAATYRWRGDLADADRVDASSVATAGGGPWTFPSPDDCRKCHTNAAGFLLAVSARQIPKGTLAKWRRKGVLDGAPPLGRVAQNVPVRGRGRADARARSYMDANCSFCHRPDDETNAGLDLRATTALEDTGALDAVPQHGDAGLADPRILAPGEPARSTLLERMRIRGDGQMPQLATHVPDDDAIRTLERWILRLRR